MSPDRDTEVAVDLRDEAEHVVAPHGIQAIRGLVEKHELWVVDQRLRELHPLSHAGGVTVDRTVALFIQADVSEDVRGPLPRRRHRESGHPRHVHNEIGCRHVRRETVMFGHVTDALADRRALARDLEAQNACPSIRRR